MYRSYPKAHKAQSMLEYAVFLSVALCALVVMQFIISRSYQGRIKQESDSVGSSYSPGHTIANTTMAMAVTTHSYTSGVIPSSDTLLSSRVDTAVDDGMSVSLSQTTTKFNKREVIDYIKNED
jgi:hypothetical protein